MKKWLENVKQKRPTQRFMWFAYKVIAMSRRQKENSFIREKRHLLVV